MLTLNPGIITERPMVAGGHLARVCCLVARIAVKLIIEFAKGWNTLSCNSYKYTKYQSKMLINITSVYIPLTSYRSKC